MRRAAGRRAAGLAAGLAAVLALGGLCFAVVPATGAMASLSAVPGASPPDPEQGASGPAVSQEEADRQSSLAAAEDRRLIEVRSVAAVAPLQGASWTKPYRLNTGAGYTLVLTERSAPYAIADLLVLAPQTFVRQKDGAYLLSENIVVNPGATLALSNPGGLVLRLASSNEGFVSIVSFGGELKLSGSEQAPMQLTSWDPRKNAPDTDAGDGRAYLRAIGGQFSMDHVAATQLGFWSGRTGGVALTGTERPNTGAVEGVGKAHLTKTERQAKEERLAADPKAKSDAAPGSGGVLAMPPGALTTPDARFTVPGLSYVSGRISQTHITGNAFGLFVSGANGVQISDTTVQDSLIDGIILHRFATSGIVERTVSRGNRGDGFVLARATQEIRISGATAERNGGNGFTLNGLPLAEGPSPAGTPVTSYGNNSVTNSTARDNGHYGIEVLGGLNMGVQNNRVEGSDMGIVVRQGSDNVTIVGNQLTRQDRQAISIRDGVTAGVVTGNVVNGGKTGIYVRDSVATVRGNTVEDASSHGVTLVGQVEKSIVSYNVVSGAGPSPVDTARAQGDVEIQSNQTSGWYDTSSWLVKLKRLAHPMTVLWMTVFLLIMVSAVRSRRRKDLVDDHPYANQTPLQVVYSPREMEVRNVREDREVREDRVPVFAQ